MTQCHRSEISRCTIYRQLDFVSLTSQPLATNSSRPPTSSTSSVSSSDLPLSSSPSSRIPPQAPGLRVASWNARSLTDKHAFVTQSLLEGNLDLLAVTESWHHCSEDSSILRATPAGYSSRDNPDVGPAAGGGIVVFFKSSLRVTQVQLTLVPSLFEALCLSIATPRGPVTVLTVYRPSTTTLTLQFYEEFASVLEDLITRNNQLLILGDFNIHLEDSVSSNSLHFSQLLAQFGLHQHISEPTCSSGGWLDLVITSDEEQILNLHVQPPTISDHAFIKFVLPSIHMQPIHAIRRLRGWKAFDSQAFSSALRDSLLSIPTETLDLLTLDQLYSTDTTSLLDLMLPRHPVKSRIGLKSVWFDAECRQVRRRVRCAERRFRRSKDHDDRLSWIAL